MHATPVNDDALALLDDIALDTGFADQGTFTRRVTQRFGLPPGHWRRVACIRPGC